MDSTSKWEGKMFSIYIVITCAFATSMVVVVCKDLSISQVIDHVTAPLSGCLNSLAGS